MDRIQTKKSSNWMRINFLMLGHYFAVPKYFSKLNYESTLDRWPIASQITSFSFSFGWNNFSKSLFTSKMFIKIEGNLYKTIIWHAEQRLMLFVVCDEWWITKPDTTYTHFATIITMWINAFNQTTDRRQSIWILQ